MLFTALLAAAVGVTAVVGAEDESERILVESEGETAQTDLTVFSTTIRVEDFESRITSVTELLQKAVGLHVRSFGGLGSFATVSIRGSTAEQVNIYVDGVLLNPALGGAVNLADLPLGNIDQIEIYRGFTPAYLETGGIGGAINIRTKRPEKGTHSGSFSYGSYGTAEAAVSSAWAGTQRRVDGMVSFSGTRSGGDFRFFDNNGTLFEGDDDGFETRQNNRFWVADLLGRSGFDMEGGARLELQASATRRRQGVPGIDVNQSLEARAEMTRTLFKASLAKDHLAGDSLRIDLDAYYSRTDQEFEDRFGDTTGGSSTHTRVRMEATGPSAQLRWHPDTTGLSRHFVDLLATARFETARQTDELNAESERGRSTRDVYALSAQDEVHLAGGRLVVAPSLRWERFTNRFESEPSLTEPEVSGKIGAAWHIREHLTLRGNAGRFHRLPNFTEIFGDEGSVKGNLDLVPESGWNYDLGVTWEARPRGALDRFYLETVAFLTEADDLIQFVQTSQSQVVAHNTGRARITGAELSLALGMFDWLGGSLNYTYQIARDDSDTFTHGSDLPGRPRHELSARADAALAAGRWGRCFYEFDYIGRNFVDQAAAVVEGRPGLSRDQLRVPGRYLHGAGYTRSLGDRYGYSIEVDNIANVKTVDVVRYPLPGRVVQGKLRVKLP